MSSRRVCLIFLLSVLQHTIIPRGSLSLKVLAELPIIVVLMYQVNETSHKFIQNFSYKKMIIRCLEPSWSFTVALHSAIVLIFFLFFYLFFLQLYKLNIHNVVSEFVPLIMSTIMLQVSPQARSVSSFYENTKVDFFFFCPVNLFEQPKVLLIFSYVAVDRNSTLLLCIVT